MSSLFSFLASAVGPLAIRVLIALGFASVSFAGVTAAFSGLTSYAQTAWAGLPAAVLQLATLGGFPAGVGIIMGAMAARIGLWAAANGTRMVLKS